jgi:DNA integrity scanning protein DisA with diadenylate cyclase activity
MIGKGTPGVTVMDDESYRLGVGFTLIEGLSYIVSGRKLVFLGKTRVVEWVSRVIDGGFSFALTQITNFLR